MATSLPKAVAEGAGPQQHSLTSARPLLFGPVAIARRANDPSTTNRFGTAQTVTAGSGPSNSVTVSTATNRITSMGAANFSYDANGNLTQDDLYKYKYDAENRMVELRNLTDVLIATYAFDGNSLRVVKVVGADRTWYLYAGTQLVSEYEDAASNTYSPGTTPGAAPADTASTILYQHADHLTTRLTTENSGDLSNEQAHYPYGESWYESGTANPSVLRKYTSYYKDDEAATGRLNYAVFREHGARIGRFHMADPVRGNLRNPQRLNRYAYVANDPANRLDPTGRDWEPSDCAVDPTDRKCPLPILEADASHPWTAEYYFTGFPYPPTPWYSPWNPLGLPDDIIGWPDAGGGLGGLLGGGGGGGGVGAYWTGGSTEWKQNCAHTNSTEGECRTCCSTHAMGWYRACLWKCLWPPSLLTGTCAIICTVEADVLTCPPKTSPTKT